MRTRYEIEIGRLVLDGVPEAERQAVRAAVEREVARRAAEGSLGGLPGSGGKAGNAGNAGNGDARQVWTLPASAPAGRSSR